MMVSVFKTFSSVLLAFEILVGILANGFIVLMNYIDWLKTRKLSPNDQILSCLCFSRLAWLAFVILDRKTFSFSVGTHHHLLTPMAWALINTSTVWFATWLSVFYLAKIATFSHPAFLQVKLRFPGLVPWLLLGSVVFSAMMAIAIVTGLSNDFSMCESNKSLLNISNSKIKFYGSYMYIDILHTVSNIIPLMLFLSSSILLLISLWKHKRRMQCNGTGIQDLNTQAHLSAIKALASFIVLYLSSFLTISAQAVLIWKDMVDTWLFILLSNINLSYPSGHAILLILTNTKLKQAWVRMLHQLNAALVKCLLKT